MKGVGRVVLKRNTFLLLARSAVNTQHEHTTKVVASCQIAITSSCSSVETHLRCANLAARSLVAQNQTRDIMAQAMFLASTAPHVPKIAHRRADRSATSTAVRKSSNPRASRTRVEAFADGSLERRELLAGAATSLVSIAAFPRVARADEPATTLTQVYNDEEDKYSLAVPGDWERALGDTSPNPQSTRKVVAFYPPGQPEINVNVVATALGADYPKMGSFGSPFEFGYNMVNPMNKPKAKKGREDEVQYSELIEAGSKGLNYFVEYELTRPSTGIDSKQLVVAGIGYDGRVSHLYSTTAQMPKGEEEKWRPEIEKILESLVLPPPLYN